MKDIGNLTGYRLVNYGLNPISNITALDLGQVELLGRPLAKTKVLGKGGLVD